MKTDLQSFQEYLIRVSKHSKEIAFADHEIRMFEVLRECLPSGVVTLLCSGNIARLKENKEVLENSFAEALSDLNTLIVESEKAKREEASDAPTE